MQKRNVLNSPRLLELKKHRRRVVFKKMLLYLLGLATFFVLLVFLSQLDSLNITEIKISGNRVTDTEALKKTVEEQITGNYFGLFPKTNFLIYPRQGVEAELKNKFKRIKEVVVSEKKYKNFRNISN